MKHPRNGQLKKWVTGVNIHQPCKSNYIRLLTTGNGDKLWEMGNLILQRLSLFSKNLYKILFSARVKSGCMGN